MRFFLGVLCLCQLGIIAGETGVLTGNAKAFGAKHPKNIIEGATLKFVTEGKFATDAEMLATGSRPNGTCKALLDGKTSADPMTLSFHTWGGGTGWCTAILDLTQPAVVESIVVWSQEDDARGIQSFEVLASLDGKEFFSMGSFINPRMDRSPTGKGFTTIPMEFRLSKPVQARYLEVRIARKKGLFQMIVGEIAAVGRIAEPGDPGLTMLPSLARPAVRVKSSGIQEAAIRLDWSEFAKEITGVKGWFIYRSSQPFTRVPSPGVELVSSVGADTTSSVKTVVPGETSYWGVVASYSDGAFPEVACISHRAPKPYQRDCFGDMLAINHFWGGGGARQHGRPSSEAWEQVAVELLAETPFKQIRWWRSTPSVVQMLYERGIGVCIFPNKENYEASQASGCRSFTAGNEPDLSGRTPAEYLKHLKEMHTLGKQFDPQNCIAAPTSSLCKSSRDWLDDLYKEGAKPYFDVLDLHTYVKIDKNEYPVPDGYPCAAPESLFVLVPKIKEIMAKYGDQDKPMISTEFGYCNKGIANFSGNDMDQEQQAHHLVRGLIIHYILDFKRVFVYSFWDEGEDPDYTEHHFGMIDYKLQKKISYDACVTLGEVLGKCTTFQKIPGTNDIDLGWNFHDPSSNKNIAAMWNGAKNRIATCKTTPGKLEIIDFIGNKKLSTTDENGFFKLPIGGRVTYVQSEKPVEIIEIKDN